MQRSPPLSRKTRIAFLLPHLETGGIEHVVLRLLNNLDRDRFEPLLFLGKDRGALRDRLAGDVARHDGGGRRALLLGRRLAGWLAQQRVDLAYSGTNAMNIAALLAGALPGAPHRPRPNRPRLIISEHTSAAAYLATARGPRIRRLLVRSLYPRADLLVTPTEALAREWTGLPGLGGLDHAVAPNPVLDLQILQGLAAAPPPRVAGRIVAAGRLVPDKGHDIVIEAVARLAPDLPDLHLKIFGEGPDRPRLAALIAARAMTGRITLDGMTDTLMHEMARAEVFALGSRREGFGNVVVEALAAGARVVASDCPGPREVLDAGIAGGGRLGRLVAPGDVTAMADALRATLHETDNPARRQAGLDRTAPYRIPDAVRRFEAICDRLLARSSVTTAPGQRRSSIEGRPI